MGYWGWSKYVPVAQRRAQAAKKIKAAQGKGKPLNPVCIDGRTIAKTFWGKAWCEHLESFSDYENRLPRGRTYLRNGSVIDLQISKGAITSQVMGSSLYQITIEIKPMLGDKWKALVKACSGKIDSLIELLQGKFSQAVMSLIIDKERGLFPKPSEISMNCSCPDHAGLCKHIAAVFYAIGASLDLTPQWLFTLRHVDHVELVASASESGILARSTPAEHTVEEGDISSLFGIEMAPAVDRQDPPKSKQKPNSVKPSLTMNRKGPLKPKRKPDPVELLLPQAALLLNISEGQLTRLLNAKKIPFSRVGKEKRISFEEILKYRTKAKLSG